MAYATASTLTEVLAGVPFADYIEGNVWDRLGMNDTFYGIEQARATGRLVGGTARNGIDHEKCFATLLGKATWPGMEYDELPDTCYGDVVDIGWYTEHDKMNAGAGGVITCANDMATWLKTLLLEGRHPATNETIIPADVIAAVATPYTVADGKPPPEGFSALTYGMGQMIRTYRGYAMVEHGGSVPGHMSQVLRFPDAKLGIFVSAVDSEFGSPFHEAAKLIIADHALGLDRLITPLSVIQKTVRGLSGIVNAVPKRPDHPAPPSSSWTDLTGVYRDDGYGELCLCPVEATFRKIGGVRLPTELARRCRRDGEQLPFNFTERDPPTFVSRFPKLWVSHLAFTHIDGDVFKVSTAKYWPETQAKTGSQVFDGLEGYMARFGDGGVGIEGNFYGAGGNTQRGNMSRHGVEKGAEVFFQKD